MISFSYSIKSQTPNRTCSWLFNR